MKTNSKEKTKKTKGLFISFEGPECAGKTTQISLLERYLTEKKISFIITREPGGTEVGEKIREIVKHLTGHNAVVDEAEVLLFAASRAQHVKTVIDPAIRQNIIVISDRYVDSTTAYQGYARGLDMDFITRLNKFASCGIMPNITFLLDLPPEEMEKRRNKRQETLFAEDRIESEEINFHRKVRDAFLKIATDEPERVKIIPAIQSPEAIHKQIKESLENAIKGF
jgi:dTMP kinase